MRSATYSAICSRPVIACGRSTPGRERARSAVLHRVAETRRRAERPLPTFCSARVPAVSDGRRRVIRPRLSDNPGSAFCACRDGLGGATRELVGWGRAALFVDESGAITVDLYRRGEPSGVRRAPSTPLTARMADGAVRVLERSLCAGSTDHFAGYRRLPVDRKTAITEQVRSSGPAGSVELVQEKLMTNTPIRFAVVRATVLRVPPPVLLRRPSTATPSIEVSVQRGDGQPPVVSLMAAGAGEGAKDLGHQIALQRSPSFGEDPGGFWLVLRAA
jgi:hypothetical protein